MNYTEKDVPIIAIIPCDPQDRLEEYRHIPYKQTPFHIKHNCEKCNVEGWIGPKQLTMKNLNPEVAVICSNCLVKIGGPSVFANVKALGD